MPSHIAVVGRILSIEEDVLGAYFYRRFDAWTPQHIEIYYPVIGLVAPYLNVSVEALSVVVLIHELSHAYTHLGQDIDGLSWDTDAFGNVNCSGRSGRAPSSRRM